MKILNPSTLSGLSLALACTGALGQEATPENRGEQLEVREYRATVSRNIQSILEPLGLQLTRHKSENMRFAHIGRPLFDGMVGGMQTHISAGINFERDRSTEGVRAIQETKNRVTVGVYLRIQLL